MIRSRIPPYLPLALCGMLLSAAAFSNNIQVSNTTLVDKNSTEGSVRVRFDIGWENSWRTSSAPNNWDAAWVFVKYKDANTGRWHHASLNDAGHTAPGGSTISAGLKDPGSAFDTAGNPAVGVFLYRSANGTGTFAVQDVELRWNYGVDVPGYLFIEEVRVFAVEMVYVNEGAFVVGSGGTEINRFKDGPSNVPFPIASEGAMPVANTAGSLWAAGQIQAGTIPADYPKGFAAFYSMKHLVAQQDYVNFLNTLTRLQQNSRTGTALGPGVTSVTNRYVMSNTATLNNRNGIRCDATIDAQAPINFYCDLNGNGTGGESDDGQWVAVSWLNWPDMGAYLDWCGLRPMTELEYEKMARGPLAAVPNEHVWGTTSSETATSYVNAGSDIESALPVEANLVTNAVAMFGPGRVGLFTGPTTDRAEAGAGYYGALELSGTLWGYVISAGNATGRNYTGVHGDGQLSNLGNMNEGGWPGSNDLGIGYRNGAFTAPMNVTTTSSRFFGINTDPGRRDDRGGRGVRNAP